MKDKCNEFDSKLAHQFLKYKDDIKPEEKFRECYRHANRVANSPFSSKLAKSLIAYYVKQLKSSPQEAERCLENLTSSCEYIIAHSVFSER